MNHINDSEFHESYNILILDESYYDFIVKIRNSFRKREKKTNLFIFELSCKELPLNKSIVFKSPVAINI